MFAAGERPTGSRDPYGLRRAAQGVMRILVDLPELTGVEARVPLGALLVRAEAPFADLLASSRAAEPGGYDTAVAQFLTERLRYVLEQRGHDVRNVRAVTHGDPARLVPLVALRKLAVLADVSDTDDFRQLAALFKRVRNIVAKNAPADLATIDGAGAPLGSLLQEPAERALWAEFEQRQPAIVAAVAEGQGFRRAFEEAARFGPAVATFFDDVMVMSEDAGLREARLRVMFRLEHLILQLADVSEIVPQE
jgi:glycyl-tRNA synthetase beta chain